MGAPEHIPDQCAALTISHIAQEMGPHKITVNSYAPGSIDTAMCESRHDLLLSIFFINVSRK